MRIFIGLVEIANIVDTYAKGFRALGHETLTMVWERNPFYPNSHYDLLMNPTAQGGKPGARKIKKVVRFFNRRWFGIRHFQHASNTCDVFVFNYGTSFLPDYMDFPLLKRRGKKIVTAFWGSDIRYWHAYQQEFQAMGMLDEVRPFIDYIKTLHGDNYHDKLRIVRAAEKYADVILSQQGYGQLQSRSYMRANIPLDLSQYKMNVPDRQVPVIVHAPSNRGTKGTKFILDAIESLRSEGIPVDFRLIENMPNDGVRALLAESDIVVDELFSETIGVLSTEGMATGNAVLVRYQQDYAHIPAGCPAVNVNKDTLRESLRRVILDRDLRRKLANAGRPFVEQHYDHVKVARQILDWLEPGGIAQYDFTPTFYRNFVLSPDVLRQERWNIIRRLLG